MEQNDYDVMKNGGYLLPMAPVFGAPSKYGYITFQHGRYYRTEQIPKENFNCFSTQYYPLTDDLQNEIRDAHQAGESIVPGTHPLCPPGRCVKNYPEDKVAFTPLPTSHTPQKTPDQSAAGDNNADTNQTGGDK